MLRIPFMLAAGAMLVGTAPAIAQRPALRMTCHEMLRGQPMRDATVYTVIGDTLYCDGVSGRVPISREGRRLQLDTVRDRGVQVRTYASHVRRGAIVRRTIYWQRAGGPVRARFTETLDFARQRMSDGGPDTCNHNAY